MKTFKVGIRLPSGQTTDVRVEAQNHSMARQLVESQYANATIIRQPAEAR
jgi:hypothetical protein